MPQAQKTKRIDSVIKIVDLVSKIAGICVPVIIFYVGFHFNQNQQAEAKERQDQDRLATLIKSLSSQNKTERTLALAYCNTLKNLDKEILALLSELRYTESDPEIANSAQGILEKNEDHAKAAGEFALVQQRNDSIGFTTRIAPRIYIQVAEQSPMDVSGLIRSLKNANYIVPPLEKVNTTYRKNTLIYYDMEDLEDAKKIKAVYTAQLSQDNLKDSLFLQYVNKENLAGKIRSRHFELYLK